jgi:hypothetical protein
MYVILPAIVQKLWIKVPWVTGMPNIDLLAGHGVDLLKAMMPLVLPQYQRLRLMFVGRRVLRSSATGSTLEWRSPGKP